MRRYVLGAAQYWKTSDRRHEANRGNLAVAFEPWRETVRAVLLSDGVTEADIAELAQSAPSIELKTERFETVPFPLLPLGDISATVEPTRPSLVHEALLLPAYLAPIRYIPMLAGPAQRTSLAVDERTADEAYSILLRSEDTPNWETVRDGLVDAHGNRVCLMTAPAEGVADRPLKLASPLVLPEPVALAGGGVAMPSEIYVYAHGFAGPAFSAALRIHFKFSVARRFSRRACA